MIASIIFLLFTLVIGINLNRKYVSFLLLGFIVSLNYYVNKI
ncbi:hypothetical protein B4147_2147 [Bacillus wiedmannii]|uniref:Uncharacterized protein n=1 Tax=Bacillus wiedmannii TaxID=1890302 RepID=A0A0G8C192_9BACI|nr:hypothetical protein B4147_2147 [Bacillus wiedmannii]